MKTPVTVASTATLNATTPAASFNKDSPSSILIIFLGKFNPCVIDFTATKSVGDITAAKANETDNGIPGIRKCIKIPPANTVIKTKPNARSKIGFLSSNSSFLDTFCPSLNSNGAMIHITNISGLNENENLNGKIDNIIPSTI